MQVQSVEPRLPERMHWHTMTVLQYHRAENMQTWEPVPSQEFMVQDGPGMQPMARCEHAFTCA